MKQDELNKVAATAIRKLNSENEELKTKLAAYNKAASLVSELFKEGSIAAEDVLPVIDKFNHKSLEELGVIEKAIDLHKSGSYDFTFGKLSELPQDDGTLDPLTRMLLDEY